MASVRVRFRVRFRVRYGVRFSNVINVWLLTCSRFTNGKTVAISSIPAFIKYNQMLNQVIPPRTFLVAQRQGFCNGVMFPMASKI